MNNIWADAEADAFIESHGSAWGSEIAHLAYATRLVGSQPDLAMHGGGNTSLKGTVKTVAGDEVAALFVKASGVAMEAITPPGFVCLDHAYLKKLRAVSSLTDETMADEFRMRMLKPSDQLPSIETLMHAFIGEKVVVHTHPTAILALTNRTGGEKTVVEALGDDVGIVPYADAGLPLGRAVADELDRRDDLRAIVMMHHGLVTWGSGPKQAYDTTIEIVTRAEEYLRGVRRHIFSLTAAADRETARTRYARI
ncbi:MAG: class II aldolase/adducin family protein, partial [Syntrophales bacterium]